MKRSTSTKPLFLAASHETTHRTHGDRTAIHATVRRARLNIRAILAPDNDGPRQLMQLPALHLDLEAAPAKPSSLYSALRAALNAGFTSRIAHVSRHTPAEEVATAIAALRAERDATLDALKAAQPSRRKRRRKRRRGYRSNA